MKINYRYYGYGGAYTEEQLSCPDDTVIVPIEMQYASYKVSDSIWTKDYLVVMRNGEDYFLKQEDLMPVFSYGDYTVGMLNHVHLIDSISFSTLEDVTRLFKGLFLEWRKDDEPSLKELYRSTDIEEYIRESKKYLNILTELDRILKFTPVGIEVGAVSFYSSLWFTDLPKIETYTIPYKQVIKTKAVGRCEKIFRDRIKEILENY